MNFVFISEIVKSGLVFANPIHDDVPRRRPWRWSASVSCLTFVFYLRNALVVFGQCSEKILEVPLDDLDSALQRVEQPEIQNQSGDSDYLLSHQR
jgi:hypothetical protein